MKNVGSNAQRQPPKKETSFFPAPYRKTVSPQSHNLGSHFSVVWVMATVAVPEVNREWALTKGRISKCRGLSAPLWEPARTEQSQKGFGALRWTKGPGPRFPRQTPYRTSKERTHLHIRDRQRTSSPGRGIFTHQQQGYFQTNSQDKTKEVSTQRGREHHESAAGPPHQPPSSWAGQSRRF